MGGRYTHLSHHGWNFPAIDVSFCFLGWGMPPFFFTEFYASLKLRWPIGGVQQRWEVCELQIALGQHGPSKNIMTHDFSLISLIRLTTAPFGGFFSMKYLHFFCQSFLYPQISPWNRWFSPLYFWHTKNAIHFWHHFLHQKRVFLCKIYRETPTHRFCKSTYRFSMASSP